MANSEQIVRDIEQSYAHYIDAFNREDIDLFMQSFDLPFAALSGEQGATVFADEAARQRFYTQIMSSIHKSGWARSGIDLVKVWPHAENLATLMADVTRYKKDGSILERLRAFYTLRNDGKAWKIVTLAMAYAPFPGPGDIPRA
jgi:ketosteroid isomerase-like protein